MEEKKTVQVTVDGSSYAYPCGTLYRTIAADFQDRYSSDILLVNRSGKLCELHKPLDRDCSLRFLTARDIPGIQTYERSALFLLLKAFYDVAGKANAASLSVGYSLSRSLFLRADGITLDQALLDRVGARMRGPQGPAAQLPGQLPRERLLPGRLRGLLLRLHGAGHRLYPLLCPGAV